MTLRAAVFIARQDLAVMLRRRETLLWTFVMPILLFYFVGTMTGGVGSPTGSAERPDALAIRTPEQAGFLVDELVRRLEGQNFRVERPDTDKDWERFPRQLTVTASPTDPSADADGQSLTERALAGEPLSFTFENGLDGPNATFDQLRVARAVYTVLADLVVVSETADGPVPSAAAFAEVRAMPRGVTLDIRSAGRRNAPPTGYAQAVPGTLVMFTMLVLLTTGTNQLVVERSQGLLRRLASTPISRGSVVLGKLGARVALGMVQIGFAMTAGTVLFGMDWGPSVPMVIAVLGAWATFNAALAIVLGNVARTAGQSSGIGVMTTMILAALGGAWWPIEITPAWMQQLGSLLPTGWAMNAIHRLINFVDPPLAAVPHLAAMLGGALVLGWIGAVTFRYDSRD